jgi:LAO/AO transport system kinase
MKAGLMEVADVFAVNKADRDGAHALMAELRFMVHLHYTASRAAAPDVDWEIPVLATQAVHDVGVGELLAQIKRHRATLEAGGALERRRRARRRRALQTLLVEELTAQVMERVQADADLARLLEAVTAGAMDPYSAVTQIVHWTLGRP